MEIDVALLIKIIMIVACLIIAVVSFFELSKEQKKANIKEWLKWAVTEAEKDLGSGTGQLKLRKVYDLAVQQFPWIVSFISFKTFSDWVDDALEWMDEQLSKNNAIQDYVENAGSL